jgi:hypothetical protein
VIDARSNLLQNPVIARYHEHFQELIQSADTVHVNLRKHQTANLSLRSSRLGVTCRSVNPVQSTEPPIAVPVHIGGHDAVSTEKPLRCSE